MVRENLSVVTSFNAFSNSENAIFSFLVTVDPQYSLRNGEKRMTDNFSLLNQVRTVVSTLQDGFFEAYYFKHDQCLVEIYLSRVSLFNFWRILAFLIYTRGRIIRPDG